MDHLVLGTRGSDLARVQAEAARALVVAAHPDLDVELRVVRTRGDQDGTRRLRDFGGTGAFTAELDLQVLSGEVDAAVHSLKDLPTDRPAEHVVACHLPRGAPGDALVAHAPLEELPDGARVGTGSLRRGALLLHARPDLQVVPIRGNVPTRVARWRAGDVAALVLAEAGLQRLGLDAPRHALDEGRFPPAPSQGVVALATRRGSEAHELLAALDHADTRLEAETERRVLAGLGGGCLAPLGVRAVAGTERVRVTASLLLPDGSRRLDARGEGPRDAWRAVADELVEELRADGAEAILAASRPEGDA